MVTCGHLSFWMVRRSLVRFRQEWGGGGCVRVVCWGHVDRHLGPDGSFVLGHSCIRCSCSLFRLLVKNCRRDNQNFSKLSAVGRIKETQFGWTCIRRSAGTTAERLTQLDVGVGKQKSLWNSWSKLWGPEHSGQFSVTNQRPRPVEKCNQLMVEYFTWDRRRLTHTMNITFWVQTATGQSEFSCQSSARIDINN